MVGSTVSVKHPIFSVVFAPEDIGGRIVLAFSAQNCTTVVTFDGVDGRVLSMEPFKNDFIELVTGLWIPFGFGWVEDADWC